MNPHAQGKRVSSNHTDKISGEREREREGRVGEHQERNAIETTQMAMNDNTMYFDLSFSLVSKAHYILGHVPICSHC